MQITLLSGLSSLFGASRINIPTQPPVSGYRAPPSPRTLQLQSLLGNAVQIRSGLEDLLQRMARSTTGVQAAPAAARSVSLGLRDSPTAATLSSTEEVNSISTSYSPFGPSFEGSSSSLPTISGVYAGADDDTLTFRVTRGGFVGGNRRLRVKVFNGAGDRLDTIDIDPFTAPNTPFALSNGLVVSFGAGRLVKNDTFQVEVFRSVGSAVDPDNPFNGTRNSDPNFEPGRSVSAGRFLVNGVTILVADNDSIRSVLAKINSSGAGVTATFDADAERVVLTQDTPGASPPIVLGGDTSGFLAATKLAGASVVPGRDSDLDTPIARVDALGRIHDGRFFINGTSITVQTATDTLRDVLNRINRSGAGVIAGYDTVSRTVRISAAPGTGVFELDDGGSRFFSALQIQPGTYGGSLLSRVQDDVLNDDAADLQQAGSDIQGLLAASGGGLVTTELDALKSALRGEVQQAFRFALGSSFDADATRYRAFGLQVSFVEGEPLLEIDDTKFAAALQTAPDDFQRFLFADPSKGPQEGVLPGLVEALRQLESDLTRELGSTGNLFSALV